MGRFSPLQEIRLDANLIKDVQNIATMIVDPDGKGLNDFITSVFSPPTFPPHRV
ncbi:hypothetical protein [Ferrovum myxofaciens]|uniref:hypothetical protein n=1 Tax=Ferrovum myxofaciens TaxID=416213 RepID=UPI000AE3019C|nr:hypothetical protein [Ferrovum myxofaciens]